jgi:hypothetical protein
MGYVVVRFGDLREYLEELKVVARKVTDGLVRATFVFRKEGTYPFKRVTLVSTCMVGMCVLRYETFAGELWGAEFTNDAKVREEMNAMMSTLTREVKALALEVRSGIIDAT